MTDALKELLDEKVRQYNRPQFIEGDPICIPHSFSKLQDREIAGLFAATLAWGNRTTIINNCRKLMLWMDNAPHDFILHHRDTDLKRFLSFVHRTFNATDLLYFIDFLQWHYQQHPSLQEAFVPESVYTHPTTEEALVHFQQYFFLREHPHRTQKHVATPAKNSACKRLSMYLRWMVRHDDAGVDMGLWKKISPAQLICPLDVHVARVSCRLGLIPDTTANWKTATALTHSLREMNPTDPSVYDFALFSLGAEERF